ncbi:MAG: GtrA family protein [Oscillospiraceae bacterium]
MSKKEVVRSLKFLMFSASAGIIEIAAFSVLNDLTHWSYWPCYLIALVLSVLWNFTLNRRYTFQSANNVPLAMAQVLGFYCVFTPVSTILGNYLADTLLWNEYLVTAMNMAANFILEYLYDRFVVFRKSLDTNSIAKKHAAQ